MNTREQLSPVSYKPHGEILKIDGKVLYLIPVNSPLLVFDLAKPIWIGTTIALFHEFRISVVEIVLGG